ncbi:MAG: hypothetical protein A3D92_22035, partial [Bacteroidetes bacterium RIFCSPHIGHO2_02_FULL_44_7]
NRGAEYFTNQAVHGLRQVKTNQWAASVDGTEPYNVRVILREDIVIDYSCSCPYDSGPVCKHIVAVLYELRARKYGEEKEESLDKIVSGMPRKSLEAVVLEYAGQEPDFADYISAKNTLKAPKSEKEKFRRIIKDTVRAAMGRHGFIGYWQCSKAVEGAQMVLDKARALVSGEKYEDALPIYQCLLEEMVPLLQNADDSNGSIGGVIDQAFEGLSICARTAKDKSFKQKMLNTLFDEFENKRYDGWSDWKWSFLEMAAEMVDTSKDQERLFKKLEGSRRPSKEENDRLSEYDEETILEIKLRVLERCKSQDEAESFLKEHLRYPAMRRQAIERAFKRKDLNSVKALAAEGISLDKQRNFAGLVNEWVIWMLRTAEAEKNVPETKQYALRLFLDASDFDYYRRYKKCFAKSEWDAEVENIINLIKKSGKYYEGTLGQVLIQEAKWDDLLRLVRQNATSHTLDAYQKYLSARFPKELTEIYEKVIVEELAPLVGRGSYQRLCQFLRQMKKLGAEDRIKTLTEELRAQYKNRPAMLEELQEV